MDELFIKIKRIETLIEIKKIKKEINDAQQSINIINDINLIDNLFLSVVSGFLFNFAVINRINNFSELSTLELIAVYYDIILSDLKESELLTNIKIKNKTIKGNKSKNPSLKLIKNENYVESNPISELIEELEKGKCFVHEFKWDNYKTDNIKQEKLKELHLNIYFFIRSTIDLVNLQGSVSEKEIDSLKEYLIELDNIYNSIDSLFFDVSEYRFNKSLFNDYTELLKVINSGKNK